MKYRFLIAMFLLMVIFVAALYGKEYSPNYKPIRKYSKQDFSKIIPYNRESAPMVSITEDNDRQRTSVTITVEVDAWPDEASWQVWDVDNGEYITSMYYFNNQYEQQSITLNLAAGEYSVDCFDSNEDGGISGDTSGADPDISWNSWDYDGFGEFHFFVSEAEPDPDLYIADFNPNGEVREDNVEYYKFQDNPENMTVTIGNSGGDCNESFYVSIYDEDDVEIGYTSVSGINGGQTQEVDITSSWYMDSYEYHEADDDPAMVKLYAKVDPDSWINESDENNNESELSGNVYFIEPPTYDYYGWPCQSMDYQNQLISSTFGGERHSAGAHNAIDIHHNNGYPVYSISSGLNTFDDSHSEEENYFVWTQYSGDNEKFSYYHTDTPQHNGYYRNSGIHISDICSSNGHIHFVDRTDNGNPINPMRSNGIDRPSETEDPNIFEIRLYPGGDNDPTPNWSNNGLVSTAETNNIINVQTNAEVDVVVKAGDDLGVLHGGTDGYSKGIYSIGYKMKKADENDWLIDEEDRIEFFDDLPEPNHWYYIFAIGPDYYSNHYYIVSNSLTSINGRINLSQYPNGDYNIKVITKDIDGNEDSETLNFAIIGSSTDIDDNELVCYSNELSSNSPNPFNPTTTISYSLAKNPVNPTIEIYNIKGQKVKTFELESEKGENSIMWKGKDYTNKRVSSGVYMDSKIKIQAKKCSTLKFRSLDFCFGYDIA